MEQSAYTVQIEYLLPVYRTVVVSAASEEEACLLALEQDEWGDAKYDYDSASTEYVVAVQKGVVDLPAAAAPERFTITRMKEKATFLVEKLL